MTDTSQTNALSSAYSSSANGCETESAQMAVAAALAAEDRKGENIVVLRVEEVSYLADYFIIVTGFSRVQVRAIAQSIEDRLEENFQRHPLRVEGQSEGSWILIDYGDVIAHVLMPEEREFYNLEAFWGHAERVELPLSTQDSSVSL
ncbi:MAG: ribosome silencing factor [Cyanobacteria bacterium SID2]|nr:ribosome silencing factor [Cyanobacteria bacterium SID2]MBP0006800.1 ribosome silencing factor [Cyanobacteria bacterium SBC]